MGTNNVKYSFDTPSVSPAARFGACVGGERVRFRYFDPMADRVLVVGSFNGWSDSLPMQKSGGVWVADVERQTCPIGSTYKYKICKNDTVTYVSDPFGELTDGEPFFNSVVSDADGYAWKDGAYLEKSRSVYGGGYRGTHFHAYEMTLDGWCGAEMYERAASELCEYARQMGYTHVIVRDAMVDCKSYDRLGGRDDLRRFVDVMHRARLGVIVDWNFDNGQDIYSKYGIGSDIILHLMHSYHIDGVVLTVSDQNGADAACRVARDIRKEKSDAAIIVKRSCEDFAVGDDAIVYDERLGSEILAAFTREFDQRSAFGFDFEAGIDGICGFGDCGCLDRMPGDEWRAFAGARAAFSALMMLGGKKHTCMGCEMGVSGGNRITPDLLLRDLNARLQLCFSDAGEIYLAHSSLKYGDNVKLIDNTYADEGVVMLERSCEGESLLILINFGADAHDDKAFFVGNNGVYDEIFNSDDIRYGGSGVVNHGAIRTMSIGHSETSISVRVAPLAVSVFKKRQK